MGILCLGQSNQRQQREQVEGYKFLQMIVPHLKTLKNDFLSQLDKLTENQISFISKIIVAYFDTDLRRQLTAFVTKNSKRIENIIPVPRITQNIIQNINYKPNFQQSLNVDQVFTVGNKSSFISLLPEQVQQNLQNYQRLKSKRQKTLNDLSIVQSTLRIFENLKEQDQRQMRQSQAHTNRSRSLLSMGVRQQDSTNKKSKGQNQQVMRNSTSNKVQVSNQVGLIQMKRTYSQHSNTKKPQINTQMSLKQINIGEIGQQPQAENNIFPPIDQSGVNLYLKLIDHYVVQKKMYQLQLQTLKRQISVLQVKQQQRIQQQELEQLTRRNIGKCTLQPINPQRQASFKANETIATNNSGKRSENGRKTALGQQYSQLQPQEQQSSPSLLQDNSSQLSKQQTQRRNHSKSTLIRLFRDSKIFKVQYSSRSQFPLSTIEQRQRIEQMFSRYYGQEEYADNPIQQTNLVYSYDEKQPKRFYQDLKKYKAWLLIGKLSQEMYVGAYVNLTRNGAQKPTHDAFLFSLSAKGQPYILKPESQIQDPTFRHEFINFGNSQFRVKSGTKTVHLNIGCLSSSFIDLQGNQPSLRQFSASYGQDFDLKALQIHQIKFRNVQETN